MAGLSENSLWSEDIYRIQKTDPVLGGQDGIINIQPTQVGNRTRFLRDQLELEHNEDGTHRITDDQIADDAAISEDKLELYRSTDYLNKRAKAAASYAAQLRSEVDDVLGENGYLAGGLARIAQLNWRYGLFGAEFEFFVDGLTMRDMMNMDARGVIAYDDSIDCDDTSNMHIGMRLMVSDSLHSEEIEIRDVLERGRIRLVKDLRYTYGEDAVIGYTNWDTRTPGHAIVKKGQWYFSRIVSCLQNCGMGLLLINRDKGQGGLIVEYRETNEGSLWTRAELTTVIPDESDPDKQYEQYSIPAVHLQLRITGATEEPVDVKCMALLANPFSLLPRSIKTPRVSFPEEDMQIWGDELPLESSDFLTAYRDYYVQTEYGLFNRDTNELVCSTYLPTNLFSVIEYDLPNGEFYLKCRHQSDVGEWSLWSAPVPVISHAIRKLFGFSGAGAGGFGGPIFKMLGTYPISFGFIGARASAGFDDARIFFTTKLED